MTILQPNREKFHIGLTPAFLILAAVTAVLLNIYFYNSIVNLKHRFSERQKSLQSIQITNADFKNSLYKILDFNNLTKAAEEMSLVKDNKPIYVEAGIPVAANTGR